MRGAFLAAVLSAPPGQLGARAGRGAPGEFAGGDSSTAAGGAGADAGAEAGDGTAVDGR